MSKKNYPIEELESLFPGIKQIQEAIDKNHTLIHASNLIGKARKCIEKDSMEYRRGLLNLLIPEYIRYYEAQQKIGVNIDKSDWDSLVDLHRDQINADIDNKVALLNNYYRFFESNKIESRQGFDSRSKIRSTILEEFMFFLFKDFVTLLFNKSGIKRNQIKSGSIKAYSNLYFTSSDLIGFVQSPSVEINTKQQDYSIYREVDITVGNVNNSKIKLKIPILAIENKTYLDKTMLEGAVATAEKIKMGAPYSIYIVVTETYAVDYKVDPVHSRIDQIFVLRKCKQENNNRLPREIDSEVVKGMFWYVVSRLTRPWADIEKKIAESGTVI